MKNASLHRQLSRLSCVIILFWFSEVSCTRPPTLVPSSSVNELETLPTPLPRVQSPIEENSRTSMSTAETRETSRALFLPAEAPKIILPATSISLVRSRFVTIQFDQFWKSGHLVEAQPEGSDTLVLNLFDDAVYIAKLDHTETSVTGSLSWIGYISGIDNSQVILVVLDQNMSGTVASPETTYRVRFVGNGVHVIEQIAQAGFPLQEEPSITTQQP